MARAVSHDPNQPLLFVTSPEMPVAIANLRAGVLVSLSAGSGVFRSRFSGRPQLQDAAYL
jgi:hypothetical protein